ncbi:hypothetical protein, partial [Flavobacterium sp. YO64]|uniref:hypothetical protein n=1 Tax=Flavobacterium sp. YO64 TaxID=394559 RepID=UPI001024F6C0
RLKTKLRVLNFNTIKMELLSKHALEKHRNKIMEQLNFVPFNILFAKNVVEQKMTGEVFC